MIKDNPILDVLKVFNFQKIWISQILSQATVNFINFILVLRIFETTHSTMAVSLVWILFAIPALLIGPFSGTICDLTDKKKVLIWTLVLEAIIVLLYIFVKQKVWPIYGVIFLFSMVNQMYIPAEAATLTYVVPKRLFAAANTLFIFTIYGAFLVGYGFAGYIVRFLGRTAPYLLGSALLWMAVLAVLSLPKGMICDRKKVSGFPEFWEKVTEGYEFIRANKEVLYPLLLLTLANVLVSVFGVIAPLFATELLKIDLLDVGHMVIFPIGFGAILGGLGVIYLMKSHRKKKIITCGLTFIASSLLFFSIVLPRINMFNIPLSLLFTSFLGIGIVSLFIPAQTLIQEKTPEEFRGRVFGVLGFMFTLASVVPIVITATITDTIGIGSSMFFFGLIMIGLAIYSLKEPYLKS